MSLLTPGIICSAQNARSYASLLNGGDEPVQKAIASAINTAIDGGLFTTTVSVSGYSDSFIQANLNLLQQLGYTATISSTTLTISW